jgi:hypothetical protein
MTGKEVKTSKSSFIKGIKKGGLQQQLKSALVVQIKGTRNLIPEN